MGRADYIDTKAGPQIYLNYRPHNFKVDPEAVDIVFESKIKKVVIPTILAKQNWLTRADIACLPKTDPVGAYLSCAGMRWLDRMGHDNAYLYDPLTVAHHENPGITKQITHNHVSIATEMKQRGFADLMRRVLHNHKDYKHSPEVESYGY